MSIELLNYAKFTRVSNAVVAGTSAINSTILDMSGFSAVTFVVELDTVVDASVITATAKENTSSSTSGATSVSGASVSITASTSSNVVLIVDVVRPSKQYVYLNLTRTTQNATVDSIMAIQYRASALPVSQPASVAASALSSPEV